MAVFMVHIVCNVNLREKMSKICDLDKAGKNVMWKRVTFFPNNYEQTLKSLKE